MNPKSIPGYPKSTPNQAGEALGTPRDIQERPAGVPGASGHVPGTSQERPESPRRRLGTPKRPPGRVRERAETPKIIAEPRPEVKKTIFCAQSVHEASLDQSFANFGRFSICRQSLRTIESTAPASKNKGSALCAASRVAHALQPRKTTEIGPKTTNFATF